MPIWATHPKPLEGELFSSWLVRIASECEMTLDSFCLRALGVRIRSFKNVDFCSKDLLIRTLSEGTGTPVSTILDTFLISKKACDDTQIKERFVPYVMPFLANDCIRSLGMSYCPECLRTDKKPYYRKNWRYAFQAICPIHRIPLLSSCPHCNLPYGHTLISRIHAISDPITTCWSCKKNVSLTEPSEPWGGNILNLTLDIQAKIQTGMRNNILHIPNYGPMHPTNWLQIRASCKIAEPDGFNGENLTRR